MMPSVQAMLAGAAFLLRRSLGFLRGMSRSKNFIEGIEHRWNVIVEFFVRQSRGCRQGRVTIYGAAPVF
jgi:hypothetical protein